MINLFPDQQEAISSVIESMQRGNRSVLLQQATGAGKTYMASEIVRRTMQKGNRSWFVVPRRQLLKQTAETYHKFGMMNSYICSGKYYDPYVPLQICSLNTLRRRLDELTPPKLAIIDETHFGGAGLDTLIEWLKKHGSYIIGLSATPWKMNGTGLGCWYDDMVCGASIRWLIDNKRLSDYTPYAPSQFDLASLKKKYGDFSQKELSQAIRGQRKILGDAITHYKKYAMGKLNITYCVSIEESKLTADAYNKAGIPAHHVDGNTPDDELEAAIRMFANRELLVLTNADLLTFGFDLAASAGQDVTVESMTDLAPTLSLAKQMQKWGRVLRYKDYPAIILDHAGNINEHGYPCEKREWQLADWKEKTNGDAERTIPVRICTKCYFPHRSHLDKCPHCGHEYIVEGRTIEVKEGELEKLEVKHEKKKKRMEVGMAKTIDDLKQIAKDRGYKSFWVYKTAKAKGIKYEIAK